MGARDVDLSNDNDHGVEGAHYLASSLGGGLL